MSSNNSSPVADMSQAHDNNSDVGATTPTSNSGNPAQGSTSTGSGNTVVQGAMATVDRFMAINPTHFRWVKTSAAHVEAAADEHSSSLVTLHVGGFDIMLHREVINQSYLFRKAFNSEMVEGTTGVMELEGDYKAWLVVALAMYGVGRLPKGVVRNEPAVIIVQAMAQADYILATTEVKENIYSMLREHLSEFKDWKVVPKVDFNIHDHENKAIEINEAWKAYQDLPKDVDRPFSERGFALLLWKYCPGQIYNEVEYLLDDELARDVARFGKKVSHAMPIEPAVWALFHI
ncbi:hypothetical protein SCAR479_02161 [Seiridium cardinale]|uniref:BTB domain-containing protein n=1 Tax=Seiridium cardinale TaxID=138064 RepID=A0ABR2Y4G0_9PEZI